MATVARIRAPRCGAISKWIATTSPSRRSRRSRTMRASTWPPWTGPSRLSASIPTSPSPGKSEDPRGDMSAAGLVEVRVPDMGNFKDVAVIDVLVKPGDSIELDTPLVTLETDKATMDVPSTAVGVVEKLHASKGGKVNTGDLVATVRAAAGASAGTASQPSAAAPATASAVPAATAAQPAPGPPAAPPAPPAAPAPPPASSAAPPAAANGAAAAGRSDLAPIDEPGF